MMQQYFMTKERYPGVLLAMRVGDFYEFYGEDAQTAAKALEITLTGREDGPNGRISMAGVPFHSVEKYLAKLIRQGYKVALCDQVEDPKKAKGLVRREVTRVMTPGTVIEDSLLERESNNFLASASPSEAGAGIGFLDLSTGEFLVTQLSGDDSREKTIEEIARLNPAELLLPEEADQLYELVARMTRAMITRIPKQDVLSAKNRLLRQFGTTSLAAYGLDGLDEGIKAAGMLLNYLDKNEIESSHIEQVVTYSIGDRMKLDSATVRSLEITSNMLDGSKRLTLIELLDETQTPMGARLLRRWIEEPLLEKNMIEDRLTSVESLVQSGLVRDQVRNILKNLYDIQRLVAKSATGIANARDMVALRCSLIVLPDLITEIQKLSEGRIGKIKHDLDPCTELLSELQKAISDEPPVSLREGGIIKNGYDPELDELRNLVSNGRAFIANLETQARKETGIDKLKIGYNSVFGYYLEVPKNQLEKIPAHYIRKQTIANAERYITADLKEQESRVLGADEKACELEYQIFCKLRGLVVKNSAQLLKTARTIAEIDVLQSFAETAVRRKYVRPQLTNDTVLEIKAGRHPVVEAHTGFSKFVPNDTHLKKGQTLTILTGPNMSGKSTYLRQTALIVLMAQMGSFVPADSATIGLTDRVFARIGARDELATGQSTFMVEMTETANILHHATERSLVILDEIGRGTSTYDGLAIAWAIAEFLAQIETKTIFATHYHQLNNLADQLPNVRNFRVAVREEGDHIIWLHKVLEGGTDRSYGIQVAKMAGLPKSVIMRATEVLHDLEGKEPITAERIKKGSLQMTLFEPEESEIRKKLSEIDLSTLTPVEALVLLDNLKRHSIEK